MDERELERWAEKHRELGRRARAERAVAIAAVIGILLALGLVYLATTRDQYGGGGAGPLLF